MPNKNQSNPAGSAAAKLIIAIIIIATLGTLAVLSVKYFGNSQRQKNGNLGAEQAVNPDTGIKQEAKERKLIGGQKDEHGCLTPAGYSWCEAKQKCLRIWEEGCDIIVNTPKPDEVVSSPLKIKGEASGSWFFEAVLPVQILDENHEVIARGNAKALGEWMTGESVPFEAVIEFEKKSGAGWVLLRNDNPSGLPENEKSVKIPVRFGS